ncbi:hypothetical protein SUGI_0090490 [Cryptomeria japonica]|nr:hypothetical protein SUGI_0090490 [Cryptomeria japonica]
MNYTLNGCDLLSVWTPHGMAATRRVDLSVLWAEGHVGKLPSTLTGFPSSVGIYPCVCRRFEDPVGVSIVGVIGDPGSENPMEGLVFRIAVR